LPVTGQDGRVALPVTCASALVSTTRENDGMPLTKEGKLELIEKFGGSTTNTGSTEVQVALMTHRINELTEHMKVHKHDFHSQRGLLLLVGRRRRLLRYLQHHDLESYRSLIKELGLRR
jgi:small subunit ribosomal protein S15